LGAITADHSYIQQSQRHLLAENVQVAIGRRRVVAPSVEIQRFVNSPTRNCVTPKKLHYFILLA
jgi:hypothetical protein